MRMKREQNKGWILKDLFMVGATKRRLQKNDARFPEGRRVSSLY
jgi:hypothetical protein